MKKLIALTASISAFLISAAAQNAKPTPTPGVREEVVKISTSLVQVDVTVTDRKGNVVRDLKPEDFEIYENGEKQKISNCSFVPGTRTAEPAGQKIDQAGGTIPPPPPTAVRPEQVRRTIALVVDDLNMSFESAFQTRRALKKFVDEQMHDGDLVAIIRTGSGIGALQQFTTDKRQLNAAIEQIRWSPIGNGKAGAFAPIEGKPVAAGQEEKPQRGVRTPEGVQREFEDFRESLFAIGTLGAVDYVIRGMKDLPGRKSILLLSDGFRMFNKDAIGFRKPSLLLDPLHRLVNLANRSSVVIYTMDPRGAIYAGATAADDFSGMGAQQRQDKLAERRQQIFESQDGLHFLAEQTGGFAILDNNDLSGGIRRILDDQSYYLIGYVPDSDAFDSKTRQFNKLQVKVLRSNLEVRYRSGFYGTTEESRTALQPAAGNALEEALTSPFAANNISLRLNALFLSDTSREPFVRSLLHVNARDLTFKDLPDGGKQAVFDILGVAFGDNGLPADRINKIYALTVKKGKYDQFVRDGFVYDFTFPMKKPGAYQLRVAIRDRASGKIGSANQFVEVPNLKKGGLTLSGAILEDLPYAEWKKRGTGQAADDGSPALEHTAIRQFKRGTVLNYWYAIFNAKPASAAAGDLTSMIRIFRDGRMIFEGRPQPVGVDGQPAGKFLDAAGSLVLGTEMQPGDYVLQFVVTDKRADEDSGTATQFAQFEIVS